MNSRNNIYLEVMLAHFNNYLTYHFDGTTQTNQRHGYPDGFFKLFEMPQDPTSEELTAINERIAKEIENKTSKLPAIDNVPAPIITYNTFFGIRLNLKQLVVGHPDTRVSVVTFRYHFYKLHYLLQFIFGMNRIKRAQTYNHHLKEQCTIVYPEELRSDVKFSDKPCAPELNDLTNEENLRNVEFTVRRQCILSLSMLKTLGVDLKSTNLTDVAKIIHVLAAKEIPLDKAGKPIMDNSYIYKILKKLRKNPSEVLDEDLKFIKNYIEPLDLETKKPTIKRLVKLLEIKSI